MRSIYTILCGAALGLIVALGFGATVGTMRAFECFGRAVRPGARATLVAESFATGANCAAAAALLLVPAGAFAVWRKARATPRLG
jgi:hypothetical protein